MYSLIDLCFMCSNDNKCNIVDNTISTQIDYLMPEITIIKLRIPLRICSICEKNLQLFSTFKKDCVENSLRLEARINPNMIEKCTTFETNINANDEVCIKEEVLSESDNLEVKYSIEGEIGIKEESIRENPYDSEFGGVLQDIIKEGSPPHTDTYLQEYSGVDIEDKSENNYDDTNDIVSANNEINSDSLEESDASNIIDRFSDSDSDYKTENSSTDQSIYSSKNSDGELNKLYNRKNRKNKKFATNYPENKSMLRVLNSESCSSHRKKYFCIFCGKHVIHFARHIMCVHKSNIEVENILRFPAKHPERQRLISLIRNKGTFVSNTKTACNNGELIVSRRQSKKELVPRKYSPCPHCYGYFVSKYLCRHKRICPANNKIKNDKNIKAQSCSIELELDLKKMNIKAVELLDLKKMDLHINVSWLLNEMRDDEVANVIKNDFLLLRFASHLCKKYKTKMHLKHYATRKLRQLARLLINVKKDNHQIIDMRDLLQPKYFYNIIIGIRKLCEFNAKTGEFKKPSMVRHLRLYLKACINVQYSLCLMEQNEEEQKRIIELKELFAREYDANISRTTRKKIEENRCNDQRINDELQTSSKEFTAEENTSISTKDTSENLQPTIMENSSREESVASRIEGLSVSPDEDEIPTSLTPLKRPKIQRISWQTSETIIVRKHFHHHLLNKTLPSYAECEKLITDNPELCRRTKAQLKAWINNQNRKISKDM